MWITGRVPVIQENSGTQAQEIGLFCQTGDKGLFMEVPNVGEVIILAIAHANGKIAKPKGRSKASELVSSDDVVGAVLFLFVLSPT